MRTLMEWSLIVGVPVLTFVVLETRIHSKRLPTWTGLGYFLVMGAAVAASAFTFANILLALRMPKARAPAGFFAFFGGVAALVAIVITLRLTIALRERLSASIVRRGAEILFVLVCGLLVGIPATTRLNWW